MNLTSLSAMTVSPDGGWRELLENRPPMRRIVARLVLPLCLLPPAMIFRAGPRYGDALVAGLSGKPWGEIAVAFFLMELATFVGMGGFIRQVARAQRLEVGYYESFLVAAIAPVPLWLSSLGLFWPSLPLNAAVSLTAFMISCALIYHGICAVSGRRSDVTVVAVVQTVMGAGLVAWVLLLTALFAIG